MEETKKTIQIAPRRIVPGVETVWYEPGPEIDIVMDLKNLSFRRESIDVIFAFHVLDHYFENEVMPAILNWRDVLKPGGEVYIIVQDFEYICRALAGGDINVDIYNQDYSSPMKFTRENIVAYLSKAGFQDGNMRFWYVSPNNLFEKRDDEIVINALKQ